MPSESLKEVFELCGRDVAVSLMEHQNGVFLLMPARPFLKLERRLLLKEFDGTTASLRRIARKYCMSEVVVREVLKKSRVKLPEEKKTRSKNTKKKS